MERRREGGVRDAPSRERVQVRAGLALVTVVVEPIRAQRVDQDEEDVQVVPLTERSEVLDGASGKRARLAQAEAALAARPGT